MVDLVLGPKFLSSVKTAYQISSTHKNGRVEVKEKQYMRKMIPYVLVKLSSSSSFFF